LIALNTLTISASFGQHPADLLSEEDEAFLGEQVLPYPAQESILQNSSGYATMVPTDGLASVQVRGAAW